MLTKTANIMFELGAGIFVVADHLLPGLVSDRLLDLPDSLSFMRESGVMTLGIMRVVALLRLAKRSSGLYREWVVSPGRAS
jgi:hypothetical protein